MIYITAAHIKWSSMEYRSLVVMCLYRWYCRKRLKHLIYSIIHADCQESTL